MNDGTAARLDHLVIGADTLAQGVAWCEAELGITPGPGGRHALMSTHNRVFAIASDGDACAYAEVIAIDPEAPPPGRARWFGLDDPAVRAALRRSPRLLHAVASPLDLEAACAALRVIGQDAGEPTAARRMTPHGELRWRITLRADGMPQLDGALPTLIEWQGVHPAATMPPSGVRLLDLTLHCADPRPVEAAYAALGLSWAVRRQAGAGRTRLEARFDTPRGPVTLYGGMPDDECDD